MIVIDDQLLLAALSNTTPADITVAVARGEVFTTGSWYDRLGRAIAAGSGAGALSSRFQALDEPVRRDVLASLEELPDEIGLLSLRVVVPVMQALAVTRPLNFLNAEALGVAPCCSTLPSRSPSMRPCCAPERPTSSVERSRPEGLRSGLAARANNLRTRASHTSAHRCTRQQGDLLLQTLAQAFDLRSVLGRHLCSSDLAPGGWPWSGCVVGSEAWDSAQLGE